MIQCSDCEHLSRGSDGTLAFKCDPFTNIKEPACLTKWQLIKIDQMVQAYQATVKYYERLAPMQEKMFKVMEREMEDMDEAEKWKVDDDDAPTDSDDSDDSDTDDPFKADANWR